MLPALKRGIQITGIHVYTRIYLPKRVLNSILFSGSSSFLKGKWTDQIFSISTFSFNLNSFLQSQARAWFAPDSLCFFLRFLHKFLLFLFLAGNLSTHLKLKKKILQNAIVAPLVPLITQSPNGSSMNATLLKDLRSKR